MVAVRIEREYATQAEVRRLANLKRGADSPDGPKKEHRENGRSSHLAGKAVGVEQSSTCERNSGAFHLRYP